MAGRAGEPQARPYDRAMRIRPARVEETASLTRLALASKASWGYDDDFMERCASELVVRDEHVDDALAYVATDEDGDVVGFYVLKEPAAREAELDMLFVASSHLRSGVGRFLLDDARREARSRGWTTLLIESDPFAAPFYEREGAVLIGTSRSPSTGRELPLFELRL